MYTDDELDFDGEVADLLRRAAGEFPGYPADVAAVTRRRVSRQRRRLAVGLAAGLTAAALVGGTALVGGGHGAPLGQIAATPAARPGLFFLTQGGATWQGPDGRQVGLKPTDNLLEVLPDGQLITRTVSGLPTIFAAVSLPDGGFAALGLRRPTEPTSSPRSSVALVRPDGSVRLLTDTSTTAALIGADDSRLYLSTAGALLAMDLTTGRQQALALTLHSGAVLAGGSFAQLDAGPDVFAPTTCTLRLLDARTGAETSHQSLPLDVCQDGNHIALSPDRRWLAIAHQPGQTSGAFLKQLGVILVNMDTGQQTDQLLDQSTALGNNGTIRSAGIAWLDTGHVRVAWTHLPDHLDRTYDLSEVLQMKTVTTPTQ